MASNTWHVQPPVGSARPRLGLHVKAASGVHKSGYTQMLELSELSAYDEYCRTLRRVLS